MVIALLAPHIAAATPSLRGGSAETSPAEISDESNLASVEANDTTAKIASLLQEMSELQELPASVLAEQLAQTRAQLRQLTEANDLAIKGPALPADDQEVQALPFTISIPLIVLLISLSGLFSGLTLGLMGLDPIGLQIVQKGGSESLAKCAAKIAPVRAKGNQLLCTLLLGNVAVNSALSILTSKMTDGLVGFFASTVLIVVFGEILPQAACSRYALSVGALTVPLVKCLMCLFYILTKPLCIVLDCLLGREVGTIYNAEELIEMVKLQIQLGSDDAAFGHMAQQVTAGALSMRDKSVSEIMIPLEDAYMLQADITLGYETIREIFETGFSRIPVYGRDRNDYIGLLYTKDLMLVDPADEISLRDFINIFQRKVETLFKEDKLPKALNAFKKGGTHMGLVRCVNATVDTNVHVEICGLISLEDIVEEILQDEIVDETDVFVDVDNHIHVVGRERPRVDLAIFNPAWRHRGEQLSLEEVSAFAVHLERVLFTAESRFALSPVGIQRLIASCSVQTLCLDNGDNMAMYTYGEETAQCTFVLQGRLALRVGREGYNTEVGAFTVLGKNALLAGKPFMPDFSTRLATPEVRLLTISKAQFLEARQLDSEGAFPAETKTEMKLLPTLSAAPLAYTRIVTCDSSLSASSTTLNSPKTSDRTVAIAL